IAGATRTSEGILAAVKDALTKANVDVAQFEKSVEEAPAAAESYYPVMGSFEMPDKWDETYDIVVVGGGFAGLAASYAAAGNGARTVLIEKLSTTGGNSAINGGQYAAYTSKRAAELQQKFDLVPDTAEKHIEDTLKGGDLMSMPRLVENMVHASLSILTCCWTMAWSSATPWPVRADTMVTAPTSPKTRWAAISPTCS
ncbi:MAG: FAD-binding protein, partial [Eubacteriales bacterium]|nr:FAD-binding protein [Eubacteriales bacterium]